MKKIILLFTIVLLGCSEATFNKPEIMQEEVLPILKTINDFNFNENGLPMGKETLDENIYFYNNASNKLDSLFTFKKVSFSFEANQLKYNYNENGFIDSLTVFYFDDFRRIITKSKFEYTDNIVTITKIKTQYPIEPVINTTEIYTFKSNKYKFLTSVKADINFTSKLTNLPVNNTVNQVFEYDSNNNLVRLTHKESNNLNFNYSFTYDDKKNPFLFLNKFSPFIFFEYIPISIDLSSSACIDTGNLCTLKNLNWMLRNNTNNVTNYQRESNSGYILKYQNSYQYNLDDYPISKEVIDINTLTNKGIYNYTYY